MLVINLSNYQHLNNELNTILVSIIVVWAYITIAWAQVSDCLVLFAFKSADNQHLKQLCRYLIHD